MRESDKNTRTVEEHGIEIINMLPHLCIPYQITVYLIYFLIMWLNALTSGNGISLKYSPS